MSLKSSLFSILTVAVAGLSFSTISFAQDSKAVAPAPDKERAESQFRGQGRGHRKHGEQGQRFGRHGGMMRLFHQLNLSEEQKTQIGTIMDANKPDQATRDEMRTLFEAKRSGTITAEQQARLDTIKQQRKATAKTVHEQILNVLTAEQRIQVEQKKAEIKQRREEFRKQRELRRQQQTPAATTETTKSL